MRQLPARPVFLYLGCEEWAAAWINGGKVPLNNSRIYKDALRQGTQTPDEVHQFNWIGATREELYPAMVFGGGNVGLTIIGPAVNGIRLADTYIDDFEEGALLLCLSHKASSHIMNRLGKRVCVEIHDFEALLRSVEKATQGSNVSFGPVAYTEQANRSHYLKSKEDEWMDEYRIAVPSEEGQIWIDIPPIARPKSVS